MGGKEPESSKYALTTITDQPNRYCRVWTLPSSSGVAMRAYHFSLRWLLTSKTMEAMITRQGQPEAWLPDV
jgi:hypothetical protein